MMSAPRPKIQLAPMKQLELVGHIDVSQIPRIMLICPRLYIRKTIGPASQMLQPAEKDKTG